MKQAFKTLLLVALATTGVLQSRAAVSPENSREWAIYNLEKYTDEALAETDKAKLADIEKLRANFHKNGYKKNFEKHFTPLDESLKQLGDNGQFLDLAPLEKHHYPSAEVIATRSNYDQEQALRYTVGIWYRLAIMADAVATGKVDLETVYTEKFLRSIMYYGNLEINRDNYNDKKFHLSCFGIPNATMNIYYALLPKMEQIESGEGTELEKQACEMLKILALQCWTQPLRKDATDDDVSSVDRFRKHVWWVGGNGLAYRPVLPVACMLRSIPMVDVIADVASGGISCTSQTTYDTSFWTEGFTADGAGWGHGKQCLIWGYPVDGTNAALIQLTMLKGTAWDKKLNAVNKASLLNYLRGSNWYYCNGFNLPCLDRGSFAYKDKPSKIKSMILVDSLLKNWADSFSDDELRELKEFAQSAKDYRFPMRGYPDGYYNGTRYFYNNDDLIKKNEDYHIIVNMASVRVDGIESATHLADAYNFSTCDGMTLFQREGTEYMKIYGAYDVLQAPGITARLGMDKLTPVINWSGYCSKENFAGAATSGGESAVAGYVFDKMNAKYKKESDSENENGRNEVLYGVQATKFYFVFGDYMLAMGAGVTNTKPEIEGNIQTTIEQTSKQNRVFLYENGAKRDIREGSTTKLSGSDKKPQWLVQEGKFAYASLPSLSENSYFSTEILPQNYEKYNLLNKGRTDMPKQANILKMWVDHGAAPKDDQYGYLVYAGAGLPSVKSPVKILSNSVDLQAAASESGDVVGASFYSKDAVLRIGKRSVTVSDCAVVLLENDSSRDWTLSVTDPQMRSELKNVTVTIDGKAYVVDMPQGQDCGKPAVVQIRL